MYSEEEVKKAIALLKIRKQEKHIPNLGGYFDERPRVGDMRRYPLGQTQGNARVAALKGNWASSNSEIEEDTGSDGIDKGSVFRLWYDLAKELGYCTAQEIREGVQWVLISGTWERWESAIRQSLPLRDRSWIFSRLSEKSNET